MIEYELFSCSCHSPEHQFLISAESDYEELYINVALSKHSFFTRLKLAIIYIFGGSGAIFDEIVLMKDDVIRLRDSLNTHLDKWVITNDK